MQLHTRNTDETDRHFQHILNCSTNRAVNLWGGLSPTPPHCSHWLFNFFLCPLRTHCIVAVKWNKDSPVSRRSNLSDFLSFKRRRAFLDNDHPGHESFMRGSWSGWHLFNYNAAIINPYRATGHGVYIQHMTPIYSVIILRYILSVCVLMKIKYSFNSTAS